MGTFALNFAFYVVICACVRPVQLQYLEKTRTISGLFILRFDIY